MKKVFNIKNISDQIQTVNLFEIFDNEKFLQRDHMEFKEEDEYLNKISLSIHTTEGDNVQDCFLDGMLFLNGVDIYIREWFNMSQLVLDMVNIPLKIDPIEYIEFKLFPHKAVKFIINKKILI